MKSQNWFVISEGFETKARREREEGGQQLSVGRPNTGVQGTMPSPPGAVVDECMMLLTMQGVMKEVLPVLDGNAGRNREMKQASPALSSVAEVIGEVAKDTAQNVGMRFALNQRVREQKAGTSTPCRSPLGFVTNL